ncbi:hypothetical protein [Streptomyces humidus]|uniref:hypothetical protein n=1 Tax=Streptomyces humidus TaxID=52259 RepID=UPI0033178253
MHVRGAPDSTRIGQQHRAQPDPGGAFQADNQRYFRTQDERDAFANDLTRPQLVAVSAATIRAKGEQGPDQWQPPNQSYWCTYGRSWTIVKATYKLTVTQDEKSMLTKMLDTCAS